MLNETVLQSMTQKLQEKCHRKFGDIKLSECYELLKVTFDLERTGAKNCFPETGPLIEHNSEYFTSCSSFDHLISKFILPILILFCYANVFTLLIYRLPYFDGSCSVNFLRVKAMANFIFVQSRIFEAIHAWTYEPNSTFETIYWTTKPFVISVANICGTVSTWLTLLVTVETLLCVMLPFNFRQLCTRKTTTISLFACIFTSFLLHTTFFLTHTVKPIISIKWLNESRHFINPYDTHASHIAYPSLNLTSSQDLTKTCWYIYTYYSMNLSQLPFYELLERLYYSSQIFFSIIFPTLAMLICSVLIVTKFTFKELGEAFSQRRKCVIRLTIATTLSHLLFEGPALLTFGAAVIKGAESDEHSQTTCFLNHINNVLSIINATIPFFVFLACNEQFRHMSTIYLKAQTELRREKRAALLAVALNQRSRVGGSQADRSFAGQLLIGKVSNL